MAGESFRMHYKNKSAVEWYEKAIGLKYGDKNADLFLHLGDAHRSLLQWDEAVRCTKYREAGGSKRISRDRIESTDYVAILIEEADSRYVLEGLPILNDRRTTTPRHHGEERQRGDCVFTRFLAGATATKSRARSSPICS